MDGVLTGCVLNRLCANSGQDGIYILQIGEILMTNTASNKAGLGARAKLIIARGSAIALFAFGPGSACQVMPV